MKWLSGDNVLSTANSQQSINLTISVEDSLHNETYTCRITTINNMIVEETITMTVIGELTVPNNNIMVVANALSVPNSAIEVNISTFGNAIAGEYYNMTCICKNIYGLVDSPLALWTIGNDSISEGTDVYVINEVNGLVSTSTIAFNPLKTSNAAPQGYSCHGYLTSPALITPLSLSIHYQLYIQSENLFYVMLCDCSVQ